MIVSVYVCVFNGFIKYSIGDKVLFFVNKTIEGGLNDPVYVLKYLLAFYWQMTMKTLSSKVSGYSVLEGRNFLPSKVESLRIS